MVVNDDTSAYKSLSALSGARPKGALDYHSGIHAESLLNVFLKGLCSERICLFTTLYISLKWYWFSKWFFLSYPICLLPYILYLLGHHYNRRFRIASIYHETWELEVNQATSLSPLGDNGDESIPLPPIVSNTPAPSETDSGQSPPAPVERGSSESGLGHPSVVEKKGKVDSTATGFPPTVESLKCSNIVLKDSLVSNPPASSEADNGQSPPAPGEKGSSKSGLGHPSVVWKEERVDSAATGFPPTVESLKSSNIVPKDSLIEEKMSVLPVVEVDCPTMVGKEDKGELGQPQTVSRDCSEEKKEMETTLSVGEGVNEEDSTETIVHPLVYHVKPTQRMSGFTDSQRWVDDEDSVEKVGDRPKGKSDSDKKHAKEYYVLRRKDQERKKKASKEKASKPGKRQGPIPAFSSTNQFALLASDDDTSNGSITSQPKEIVSVQQIEPTVPKQNTEAKGCVDITEVPEIDSKVVVNDSAKINEKAEVERYIAPHNRASLDVPPPNKEEPISLGVGNLVVSIKGGATYAPSRYANIKRKEELELKPSDELFGDDLAKVGVPVVTKTKVVRSNETPDHWDTDNDFDLEEILADDEANFEDPSTWTDVDLSVREFSQPFVNGTVVSWTHIGYLEMRREEQGEESLSGQPYLGPTEISLVQSWRESTTQNKRLAYTDKAEKRFLEAYEFPSTECYTKLTKILQIREKRSMAYLPTLHGWLLANQGNTIKGDDEWDKTKWNYVRSANNYRKVWKNGKFNLELLRGG